MSKTKQMLSMISLAAASLTMLASCGSSSESKTLRIGLECDYAPFNWTETEANSYTYAIKGTNQYADGYDIQVGKYLAEKMDYKLEVVKLEWDALIPALSNGTINAVIAGMTDTEERRESIDFSDEYYRSELVLVVRSSSTYASATSLSSFANAKFVSQVSTVTDEVIDDWVTAYNVKHLSALSDFPTCAIAVQNGTADAMTAEYPVANAIVNSSKGSDHELSIVHFDQTILGDKTKELGVSVGIKKGDSELQSAINTALAGLSQTARNEMMLSAISRADAD